MLNSSDMSSSFSDFEFLIECHAPTDCIPTEVGASLGGGARAAEPEPEGPAGTVRQTEREPSGHAGGNH